MRSPTGRTRLAAHQSLGLGVDMLMAAAALGVRSMDAAGLADARTDPESVAKTYLQFVQQGSVRAAYELLSAADRKTATLDEYVEALRGSVARLKGTITKCSVSATESGRATAHILVQPAGEGKPIAVELHLSKSRDGRWAIAHGEQLTRLVSRFRAEQVESTVRMYAEAWKDRDHEGMVACLDGDYLRSAYGKPPYADKVRESCLQWESDHGDLVGISCTWQYVLEKDGLATIPAKFCYQGSGNRARFVPYLISLRRAPSGRGWAIVELRKTRTYARPREFLDLVPPERLVAERRAASE